MHSHWTYVGVFNTSDENYNTNDLFPSSQKYFNHWQRWESVIKTVIWQINRDMSLMVFSFVSHTVCHEFFQHLYGWVWVGLVVSQQKTVFRCGGWINSESSCIAYLDFPDVSLGGDALSNGLIGLSTETSSCAFTKGHNNYKYKYLSIFCIKLLVKHVRPFNY